MKDSLIQWLPDHQLGVAATLSHADELVGQVADVIFAYQSRPGGTFELEEQLAEQIAAWLNHLTDEELLERMSRLKPTHTYNPEIVLRNLKVLEGMRDEAAAFEAEELSG